MPVYYLHIELVMNIYYKASSYLYYADVNIIYSAATLC